MHRAVGVLFTSCVLTVVLATWAPLHAQTGITGRWRVDGVGDAFPWTLDLREAGRGLTGSVSSCASRRGVIPIYDGTAQDNAVSFKCKSLDGDRTLTLTGRLKADQLALTWEKHVREGALRDGRDAALFGDSAPTQFTARRVPDGVGAGRADDVRVAPATPQPVAADRICRLTRSQGQWVGSCGSLFGGEPSIAVSPAGAVTTGRLRSNETPTAVWAGEMRFEGGSVPLEIEVYSGGSGVLRSGVDWALVTRVATLPDTLRIHLDVSRPVPATDLDSAIVQRAAEILSSEDVWDRADDRECAPNDRKWSIYCALHRASIEVTGGFSHRRPALQVVRQIIDERSVGRNYSHRLRDYNNDLSTHLRDVRSLFVEAAARVDQRRLR